MAMQFAHGTVRWLAADAVSTTYVVAGLGFRPKALRFYHLGLGQATSTQSQADRLRRGVGFATSPASRACVASQSQDAAGTQVCTTGYRTDCVAMSITSTPAADGLLDLQSIDADGFTLIVDDQGVVDLVIGYEAWGGSDVVEAAIGEISEPAATGVVNYACGFRPDVVLFAGVQGTAAAPTVTRNDSALTVGATSGPASGNNIVCVGNDDDASTTSDTDGYALAGECLAAITVAGGNPSARATLSAWRSDGFSLNWIARGTTGRRFIFLAIRGGAWHVGSYTIAGNSANATTTVQTMTAAGSIFRPCGLSFMGAMRAASTAGTSTAQDRIALGSAVAVGTRQSQGGLSEDANATAAEVDLAVDYASCLAFPSATGTLGASYDLDAMNDDGFRVIVDTAGGVASEWQGVVACGTAGARASGFNNYQSVSSRGLSVSERVY